jgi:hypothetical protein
MHTSSGRIAGKKNVGVGKQVEIGRFLWPRLVELWIFLAIGIFFVIRLLGSQTARHLLSRIGNHQLP